MFAVVFALLATYRRRPVVDGSIRAVSFFGLGTPPFWFGLIVLLLFSQVWHIFPGPDGRLSQNTPPPPTYTHLYTIDALIAGQWSTEWDAIRHLVLPAITLGLATWAFLDAPAARQPARHLAREHSSSSRAARASGAGRRSGPRAAERVPPDADRRRRCSSRQLIAGSVLVEKVFNWPGVGGFISDSILRQDYSWCRPSSF